MSLRVFHTIKFNNINDIIGTFGNIGYYIDSTGNS